MNLSKQYKNAAGTEDSFHLKDYSKLGWNVFRFLKRRQEAKQAERVRLLYSVLNKTPTRWYTTDELESATGLKGFVYPLSVKLLREGIVEQQWRETSGKLHLTYRITTYGMHKTAQVS